MKFLEYSIDQYNKLWLRAWIDDLKSISTYININHCVSCAPVNVQLSVLFFSFFTSEWHRCTFLSPRNKGVGDNWYYVGVWNYVMILTC